ncbi:helix-turn-helix domain-containing protein [Actinokineospora spheciospongiae]|uniref:helix-turn-helix domain-containing protein n=1 Tax=Actinokineospora spheciospongiae TaxID=909613 RepID=UPI0015E82CC9|nr:helix-turn-helix transcriptional regulator [Actinokineospora spheciospongiae]
MTSRKRLADQRRSAGFTQEALAERLGVNPLTVRRWESGQSIPRPRARLRLAEALGISSDALRALLESSQPSLLAPATSGTVLADLRQVVLSGSGMGELPAVADAKTAVTTAHQLYQRADYDAAARYLPPLVAWLHREQAADAAQAAAYIAVAKLATKLGDSSLAWVAADRALRAAESAASAPLVGAAQYQVGCALLRGGDTDAAEQVAGESAARLASDSANDPAAISTRGALTLLSAVLAGRRGDAQDAEAHLRTAGDLAVVLGGEGNWLWTGFGPTNVALHGVSVAMYLGQPERAHQLGAAIDTDGLPSALLGRRSQVHIDLARAAASVEQDGLAVLHLLEAERVAKEVVSRNIGAVSLIGTLLGREKRSATPGLRALAERAGVQR